MSEAAEENKRRAPRVLVTRAPQQASALAEALRRVGAEPILLPAIETVEPHSFAALDAALAQLHAFHWLLFTSANAVEAFQRRLPMPGDAGSSPDGVKIAVIGSATAQALREIGLETALIAPQAVAESLADSLLPYARQPDGSPTRFLLVRAEEAREHLPDTLRAAGAEVTVAAAYRTVIPERSVAAVRELFRERETWPDAITFTSSSTARNFFALLEAAGVSLASGRPILASIGRVTTATLRELGHPPDAEAPEANAASLAETVAAYLRSM